MARTLKVILWALVASLASSTVHADGDEKQEMLRKKLRSVLSKVSDKSLKLEERGRIYRAISPRTKKDLILRKSVSTREAPWYKVDAPLGEVLEEMGRAWKMTVVLSDEVKKIVAAGAVVPSPGSTPLTLDRICEGVGDSAGKKMVWGIVSGAIQVQTAEEEENDREAHRELMKSLIKEIAGDDAKFVGDRYLLIYTAWEPETERTKKIRQFLSTRNITMNFDMTPLDAVLQFFGDVTSMDIVLSKAAEDLSKNEDLTVSLSVRELPLKSGLNLIVDATGADLNWMIRHEVIYVYTEAEADKLRESRSFYLIDISDILYLPPDFPAPELGFGGLERE
ncbi:MAG: hypothetical protein O7H41_18520 [Planctomycetota bacterium]|nr:hypothetical protein [Planctomycetota bacterium]